MPVQIGELTAYSKNFSYDHNGRLIHETNSRTYYQEDGDSYEIVYLYDESGVVGMVYTENDTSSEYYFQRNLMGDIVAIYDTNGAKVAAYTYDAWGNCKIASSTTNYAVALANPFRYRGYYFDADTNLYYLNARYYSPEFRRFISPDDTAYLTSKNVNGCNLYCYCNNDPVNFVDPSGHHPIAILLALTGVALLGSLIYSFSKALSAQRNGLTVEDVNNNNSPFIGTIFSIHSESWKLIKNAQIGNFVGNITLTSTTQLNDDKLIYGYVDIGESDYSVGSGINAGLMGFDWYISSDIGTGFNIQFFSLFTLGAGISLEGVGFSIGAINGKTTTALNFGIGWGTIIGVGVLVGMAYVAPAAAATAAIIMTPTVALLAG